ncbi:Rieske (2Fe-2S) protein [Bradyrhizobium sp. WSM471]|uniref:Rieske (2Fe-2S) protein n=1 Tax=Bradyrhizobium sp. WSM471 TaxID=319017 RepID=UPI00024D1DC2|nr:MULTISPECIES: Rieske (2Fe-2S) protein [Bradyrhizobium]EHR01067.1 ferredoxin subunit of nitrite reductase and ring-hydroxylating dioxygenase [Bradyrhizobium sp. WSM471]UFW43126.1 Rieske (2Fe-2S) protein [Bradyrhizobium canariense]
MSKKYQVCYADEIPTGGRLIVDIAGRSVGIFNVNDEYFAIRNSCPHKGAPLCRGLLDGMVTGDAPGHARFERLGEIIRCPWHGWEFDIKTGQSVFNPHKVWVRTYAVSVDAEESVQTNASCEGPDPSIETYPVTLEAINTGERRLLCIHL